MTKNEIIEAINATIAPNGVKGITAESLANILTEIVNATPEGGGGVGGEYIDFTLANPDDPSSMELTAEAKAHNAALFNTLMTAFANGGAIPSVSCNMGMMSGLPTYCYASIIAQATEDSISMTFPLGLELPIGNYAVPAYDLADTTATTMIMVAQMPAMCMVLNNLGEVLVSIPGLM